MEATLQPLHQSMHAAFITLFKLQCSRLTTRISVAKTNVKCTGDQHLRKLLEIFKSGWEEK
jgi:hypothetical protein